MSRFTITAMICLVAVLVFGYLYRPDLVRDYFGFMAPARNAEQAMLFANEELFAVATKLADAEAVYGIGDGGLAVAMNAQGTTSKDGVALDSIADTVATGDEIIALIDQTLKDVERAKSFVTSSDSMTFDGKSLMFKNQRMCDQAIGSYSRLLDTMLGARISEAGVFPTLKKIQSTLDGIKTVADKGIRVRDHDKNPKPPTAAAFFALCEAADTTPVEIQVALDLRANVNAKDKQGLTPLFYAARHTEDPEVLAVLIAGGAGVNARTDEGMTPITYAARYNANPEVFTVLIDAGASVKADSNGWTPLHEAAHFNENSEVVTALIGAGADVNATNDKGETPLDFAENKGKTGNAEILRAAGGKLGKDLS